MTNCDSIFVLHKLYPDAMTIIKEVRDTNNYFQLTLNPSLAAVSFAQIHPRVENNTIVLTMPWLEMQDAVFVKESN